MSQRSDKPHATLAKSARSSGVPSISSPGTRPINAAGGRKRPSGSSQEMSPRFLFNSLLHWWKIAMPVGIVLALASASVVWWLFEPVYQAHALLQIRETPPALVFDVRKQSKGYVETQKEMLRSARVLRPVVSSAEIRNLPEFREKKDKVKFLQKHLELSSVGKSEFLRVGYQGCNPKHAAKIVNAVVGQYFDLLTDVTDEQVSRVITLLDAEITDRKKSVESKRKMIRTRTLTETGNDPFATTLHSGANWPHPLAELQNQLTTTEVEREVLEADLQALQEMQETSAQQSDEVLSRSASQAIQTDLQVQALESQIWISETNLHEMESRAKRPSADRQCITLAENIVRDKKRLDELKLSLEQKYLAEFRSGMTARRAEVLANKKAELESCRRMEEALRERYEKKMKKVVPGIADMVNLEFDQAELARATDVLNRIEQRVVELRTEKQAPNRVVLYDRAEAPEAPVVEVPYMGMGIVALVSFCLPFGAAIGWERVVRRISGVDELERETNLAVIGEIARLPERSTKARGATSRRVAQKLRLYEESIDSMRTFLVLAEELKDVRVLAVTSAASNEGKTSVAAQLALSLARASGKPTLLIDGDMRAPDIQEVFEVRKTPGLVEVLSGKSDLDAAIVPSWTPTVDVLPAGELKESVHRLVGNGALHAILERALQKYAYVVLDTPPVLAASESLVLAKAADASLICAMQDVSRAGQVRSACERLVAAGCRPVAAVLNGVSARRYEYNYGYYAQKSN